MTPLLFTLLTLGLMMEAKLTCITPNGSTGQCINVYNCKDLLAFLKKKIATDWLNRSYCGFDGDVRKVCCPLTEKKTSHCSTPDGSPGICVNINSCPHLLNMDPAQSSILDSYRCDHTPNSVCCQVSRTATTRPDTESETETYDPLLIQRGKTADGRVVVTYVSLVSGESTSIYQYPWLTLIEYRTAEDINLLCGGALISGRYVMTAVHCVTGSILLRGTPVSVRLGDYDITQRGKDCVESDGNGIDCTDGAITVPIEEYISHPEYEDISACGDKPCSSQNDVALLRLKHFVNYTDFIRPICLPTTDFTQVAPLESVDLFVAGWGAVSKTQSFSKIKQDVLLPFVPLANCISSYSHLIRNVQMGDGHLCAGGNVGKDSCTGDSGGPLMRITGSRTELVGIVSHGPTECGMKHVPGVYTKVYHYLPWIRRQMKP